MTSPETSGPIAHRKLALIETDEPDLLDELALHPKLRVFLWRRLDERRIIVHPQAVPTVARVLEELGLPPRFSRGLRE